MSASSFAKFLVVLLVGVLFAVAVQAVQADQEDCPELIRLLGNSPQGNKVQARFQGAQVPAYVMIVGTSDVEPVRGQSGIWISRDKYPTLAIMLMLLDENMNVIGECSYDADGVLLPPPVCAEFVLLEVGLFRDPQIGNYALVHWFVSMEDDVTEYVVQRRPVGVQNWSDVATVTPTASGEYSYQDTSPLLGTSEYRVVARAPGCEVFSDAAIFEF